jgi:TorA maturation chaperone TorD
MSETMTDTAIQRSNIYGLLALIYRAEPTEQLIKYIKDPKLLSVLSGMGAGLGDDFLKRPDHRLTEDLAVEYTRLFLGPGRHISPHESVHHERDDGDWGSFWGRSTLEVKKFIEAAGLEYNSRYSGLPDHISVEFEFMQQAARRQARAREENDNQGGLYCMRMEKKFIEEHLIRWVPIFCDKVIAEASLSFYREMARVTKYFMEFEHEEMNQ